jgi:hypothetical protein
LASGHPRYARAVLRLMTSSTPASPAGPRALHLEDSASINSRSAKGIGVIGLSMSGANQHVHIETTMGWRRLTWRWLRYPYRPELHYMRGPGPKWREKHGR